VEGFLGLNRANSKSVQEWQKVVDDSPEADLVPWKKLPENGKEKDRDLVRGIPVILARAGYAIVKASN
jgi:hypothetical protein